MLKLQQWHQLQGKARESGEVRETLLLEVLLCHTSQQKPHASSSERGPREVGQLEVRGQTAQGMSCLWHELAVLCD